MWGGNNLGVASAQTQSNGGVMASAIVSSGGI